MTNKQYYIGYTNNIRRRIIEHKTGKNKTTSRHSSLKFIFCEIFLNKKDARRRELYFKTSKGRSTLNLMLREYLRK